MNNRSYFAHHKPSYKSYNTSDGKIPNNGGIYNAAGRGFPDISAVGDYGVVVVAGKKGLSGGTSMSAPIVAAMLNLVNEERLKAGKSVIGFVNPTLYKNPQIFNDITVGDQSKGSPHGTVWPSDCGNTGFSAVSGWDPVTGLGTPNYPSLLQAFMSMY